MKTKNLLVIVLLFISVTTYGQMSFGVSPGIIGFSGARVGFNSDGKFVPYVSLQYAGGKYTYDDKDPDYGSKTETSLGIYVPNVGFRLYQERGENFKTFFNFGLSKPFITGKRFVDGEEDQTFKEDRKKTKLFGMEASFGAEYFLSEHFSLSGEYGLRYFHFKYDNKDYNYTEKLNLSPTFSRITFNYYF